MSLRIVVLISSCLIGISVACAQSPTNSSTKSSEVTVQTAMSAATVLKHVEFIQHNVPKIATSGVPGPLCVYGPLAFPVLIDRKDGRNVVIAAAAEHGHGRMVALSHGDYLGDLVKKDPPTGQFVSQCVLWAASAPASGVKGHIVGVRGNAAIKDAIRKTGLSVKDLPNSGWTTELHGLQAIVTDLNDCNPHELDAIDAFVLKGGGIVTANLIWGWLQGHPGADPKVDSSPNQLYSRAGIVWTDGYAPSSYGATIPVSPPAPDEGHVAKAISRMNAAFAGQNPLGKGDMQKVAATLISARREIPLKHDLGTIKRLDNMIASHGKSVALPSEATPVKPGSLEQRVLISLINQTQNSTPLAALKPCPAAATFPGVPPASTQRVSREVHINRGQHGWKSTGLYAAPGDKITIKLDSTFVKSGCVLQIGCHSDDLIGNDRDAWKRMPQMVRRFPVNQATMEIGHSLGGLIYLDIPEKLSAQATANIEIANAIEAPYYIHGVTDPGDWRAAIRDYPAPWAELATRKLIITVPSALIRNLDFPGRLMEHWNKVVDACADLATIPHDRHRPERMVFDVQISAGYLHSGYPIMAHIKPTASEAVSLEILMTRGGWGFYHELGHNHQQGAWTFEGTGEVTCNLFTLYVLETVTPHSQTHDEVQPKHREKLEIDYLKGGAKFNEWKNNPFLALVMYQQLRAEFGWEPFKKVFAEYRKAAPESLPKNDDEKRDQWMVRFSKTIGHNLGPFFQNWGVPTSEAARKSIDHLPKWMPKKPG